jgi:hypothetical protein
MGTVLLLLGGYQITVNKYIISNIKGNVKCTLVQALRFCTGRTAHWESRSIALIFYDYGTRKG